MEHPAPGHSGDQRRSVVEFSGDADALIYNLLSLGQVPQTDVSPPDERKRLYAQPLVVRAFGHAQSLAGARGHLIQTVREEERVAKRDERGAFARRRAGSTSFIEHAGEIIDCLIEAA